MYLPYFANSWNYENAYNIRGSVAFDEGAVCVYFDKMGGLIERTLGVLGVLFVLDG
jgi:hypothetical protein